VNLAQAIAAVWGEMPFEAGLFKRVDGIGKDVGGGAVAEVVCEDECETFDE
jgi:hypothetical protein